MTASNAPQRVVVTSHPDDGTVVLVVYQGAERLAVVAMDAQRTVAVAGDLIEATRSILDRHAALPQ